MTQQLTTKQVKGAQVIEESSENLQKLLKLNPYDVQALIKLGKLYRQEQKRHEALNLFKKVLELRPKRVWAYIHVAIELIYFGEFTEAEQKLKKALEYSPHNFDVLMKLGELEEQRKNSEKALEYFRESLIHHPNEVKPGIKIAKILDKLELSNPSQESHENLQELLKVNPYDIETIIKLGKLYRQEQKRHEALNLFKKVLELRPKRVWAYIHVAIELIYFGEFTEAEQKLKKALEYSPHNFDVLMQLGELEEQKKNPEKALEYFRESLINHPNEVKPGIKIAKILYELKLSNIEHFTKTKNQLDTVFKKFPNQFNILIYYGDFAKKIGQSKKALYWFNLAQENASIPEQRIKAQLREISELDILGHFGKAKEKIDTIIQENPEDLNAQMIKVVILRKNANLIEAKKICKNILAIQPRHLESRLELAKIYSQSAQVETAISLLEETHQLLGLNIKVLRLLGSLNEASENWSTATQWYQKACQEYPDNPYTYINIANLRFLQGDTQSAIQTLQEAQVKIPNSLGIPLKLIEFYRLLGNFELSHQIIVEQLNRAPDEIELLWQLCHLHVEQGDYAAALEVLDKISTDDQTWIIKTEQRKANIYFYQYDYQRVEKHLTKAISLAPLAPNERNRLATVLMVMGRIDEARQQLKIATKELDLRVPPHQFAVPLRSHPAMITNELGINPPLMKKLQAAQQKIGSERILALGTILAEEPFYLGAALYLARELRTQGIFDQIQATLSQNSTNLPTIPQRIVQFWDEAQPPPEVQKICQSWRDRNPQYEYLRFSLKTAVAFIKEHYDRQVLKAFANCDQPATQADFFRLAYLNKMGGFYADADDLCRQSLDTILSLNPELVVIQEELAVLGNNFLGCVPGQKIIRAAFEQALENLSDYSNEGPWFATGPGLLTSAVCSSLVPYLTHKDYQLWPRILVLSQAQLRKIVYQHMSLPYKKTAKSWQRNAYQRRIKAVHTD